MSQAWPARQRDVSSETAASHQEERQADAGKDLLCAVIHVQGQALQTGASSSTSRGCECVSCIPTSQEERLRQKDRPSPRLRGVSVHGNVSHHSGPSHLELCCSTGSSIDKYRRVFRVADWIVHWMQVEQHFPAWIGVELHPGLCLMRRLNVASEMLCNLHGRSIETTPNESYLNRLTRSCHAACYALYLARRSCCCGTCD